MMVAMVMMMVAVMLSLRTPFLSLGAVSQSRSLTVSRSQRTGKACAVREFSTKQLEII